MHTESRPDILIVDDDLTVGLLARETLTQGGFQVGLAHNAEQMHQHLRGNHVDMILLDVQLPDASGIDLCRELRENPRYAHTPILMITGSDDNESILLAYSTGATDFMPKPLNWHLLLQRVRYMWRSYQLLLKSRESERLLAQAQLMALVGNWERSLDTGEVSSSTHFLRLFGNPEWSARDCFLPFLDTIPASEQGTVAQAMKQVEATGVGKTIDHHVIRPDGIRRNVRHTFELRRDAGGKAVALCGTIQDITRDKLRSQLATDRNHILELALRNVELPELYRGLEAMLVNQFPGCQIGFLARTENGWRCAHCSRHMTKPNKGEEFALPQEIQLELARSGSSSRRLTFNLVQFSNFEQPIPLLHVLPVLVGGESAPSTLICIFFSEDPVDSNASDIDEVLQTVSGISAVAMENHRLSRDLRYQAFHDTLTGLPNRFLFLEQLAQITKKGAENAEKRGVVFIDLDRFKNTNDLLGHNFGDKVLKEFGKRLREAAAPEDILARTGGDEFMLISAPLEDYAEIEARCTRIRQAMDTPFEEDNYRINLNASMGVSRYPADSEQPGTLYQFADLAMQHAKKSGGSTLRYYDSSIMDQFLERLEIENEMPGALEAGEFHLVFQPQIETDTGDAVGYEALLRWKRTDGSFISPGVFIPVAEDNGFIVTLGAWVLEQACLSIGRLHAGGRPDVKLSVNVSTVQFVQDNFPDLLHEVLEKTGFSPDRLELEVTESAVMHDIEIVAARLNALRDMGISMAIDDFGTGYSSLSYLRTLPIDSLKIDRSFIMEIGNDHPGHEKSAAMVTAIISLADNLGLSVVAEGVEDEAQLEFLRQGGCRLVHGFYTGRPGPLPDPSSSD